MSLKEKNEKIPVKNTFLIFLPFYTELPSYTELNQLIPYFSTLSGLFPNVTLTLFPWFFWANMSIWLSQRKDVNSLIHRRINFHDQVKSTQTQCNTAKVTWKCWVSSILPAKFSRFLFLLNFFLCHFLWKCSTVQRAFHTAYL